MAAMLVRAMQQAGVRLSNRIRTVGEFRLGELLSERPRVSRLRGPARAVASRRRRIRLYAAPQHADDPRRVQHRRAARREHELLDGCTTRIPRPQDYVEHDLGPALRSAPSLIGRCSTSGWPTRTGALASESA
jgi:hypothetical protein